ncbi:MAG: hypothetical protein PVI30_15660 [Myxococcales bacterium]|jgi:hypothetical protein
MNEASPLQTLYEPRMKRARELVGAAGILERLLSPQMTPRVLRRFLIEYCSLGVQITEPVEGWIRRAGEACVQQDLQKVGRALIDHAAHEAGHHEMFIADTRALVGAHREAGGGTLDAQALIDRPPTRAMRHYIELHEETLASPMPFGQVAIELEIERLSVTLLPALMQQFRRVLGEDVVDALSFLGSHAQLDVGHTRINERIMNELLLQRPAAVGDLARIGAEAMFVYLAFFEECLGAAERAEGATHATGGGARPGAGA